MKRKPKQSHFIVSAYTLRKLGLWDEAVALGLPTRFHYDAGSGGGLGHYLFLDPGPFLAKVEAAIKESVK